MRIRRYVGKDIQEAILKVKMDLGSDAVILNTRKVRKKGFLKFFSKPLVEVLAAIDEDYGKKKEDQKIKNSQQTDNTDNIEKIQIAQEKDPKISELEYKVNKLEEMLKKLYGKTNPAIAVQTSNSLSMSVSTQTKVTDLFYNNLVKNDVDPEIAKRIINIATVKMGKHDSISEAASAIHTVISNMLGKPDTIKLREDGKPTVVMFVGPTGVGKTTTLAKLAAYFALNNKKNVGLITADTYRIAAIDQLKTYADILGIPVSVVYSPMEIKDAINSFMDKDVVLIDTAGRSHKNRSQFDELKALVQASEADEIFLLMNTVTSISNCKEIIKHYGFLNNYKLIFTKLDETSVTGIILNTRVYTGKSLSYVTTGQNVPDDIEIANIEKITKTLMGSID